MENPYHTDYYTRDPGGPRRAWDEGRTAGRSERDAEVRELVECCNLTLREWYRISGCGDPECMVCAKTSGLKERFQRAIAKATEGEVKD